MAILEDRKTGKTKNIEKEKIHLYLLNRKYLLKSYNKYLNFNEVIVIIREETI